MRDVIKNPVENRFERDLQIVRLVGDPVAAGQSQRYVLSLPYDFVAIKFVCVVAKLDTTPETGGMSVVGDPPLLCKTNLAGTDVDKEFVPIRAVWGTAKFPFILPNPYPLRNGQLVSVEVQSKAPDNSAVTYAPTFSIIGYRPTRAQLAFIELETNKRYLRPLQTTVAKATSGDGSIASQNFPPTLEASQFSTTLSFDFEISKLTGSVFLFTTGTGRFGDADAEPTIWQRMEGKSQLYDNVEEPFRNVFGTGENPAIIAPGMVFRNGDTINVQARQYVRAGADSTERIPFFVFVGAVPNPNPAFVDEKGVPYSYMDKLEKARGQYRGDREKLIAPPAGVMQGGNVVRR